MQTTISIGSSEVLRLQRAVLLYGDHSKRCSFATVHDAVERENDIPFLGPASLLTVDFIRELIKGLGRSNTIEIFPESVLCRNDFVTAWWVPSRPRVLFFHDETTLADLNARTFPTPPLVFKVTGSGLSVRALAEDRRPEADTGLMIAPFWNVYETGRVCHGTMRAPKDGTFASLKIWEQAFFGSNFTHTIRDKICKHPGNAIGMWRELAGQAGVFPAQYLLPAEKETLAGFVNHA